MTSTEAVGELLGVGAAVLSSALGGASVGITRFMSGTADPLAIGTFRFGIGAAVLLPLGLVRGSAWPQRRDWGAVAGLGVLFFAMFPVLFNAALAFTTAARAALCLSTMPLLTMALGAVMGAEPLATRKTVGVLVAVTGVAVSLIANLAETPVGAWRGDLLMVAAALCMALYSVLSGPIIRRSNPLVFTTTAMGVGATCLALMAVARNSLAPAATFSTGQWTAVLFLGIVGGALTFCLWSLALRHTTPTRVAVSVTVNPISAALVSAALVGEPIRPSLMVGLVAVLAGIGLATPRAEPDAPAVAPADS